MLVISVMGREENVVIEITANNTLELQWQIASKYYEETVVKMSEALWMKMRGKLCEENESTPALESLVKPSDGIRVKLIDVTCTLYDSH